jgi:hypothetical protein
MKRYGLFYRLVHEVSVYYFVTFITLDEVLESNIGKLGDAVFFIGDADDTSNMHEALDWSIHFPIEVKIKNIQANVYIVVDQ